MENVYKAVAKLFSNTHYSGHEKEAMEGMADPGYNTQHNVDSCELHPIGALLTLINTPCHSSSPVQGGDLEEDLASERVI